MEIRTFLAVDIPQNIKMKLDELITGLRQLAPDIRWVRAANLHITLRFLGEINSSDIGKLKAAVEADIKDLARFEISLRGAGGFPNLSRPRVIWTGVGQGNDNLIALAGKVEDGCRQAGFGPADKPFSSHLTIGRVKFPKGLERLTAHLESLKFESENFEIGEVVVFKSDLSPAGPKYSKLEVLPLK